MNRKMGFIQRRILSRLDYVSDLHATSQSLPRFVRFCPPLFAVERILSRIDNQIHNFICVRQSVSSLRNSNKDSIVIYVSKVERSLRLWEKFCFTARKIKIDRYLPNKSRRKQTLLNHKNSLPVSKRVPFFKAS